MIQFGTSERRARFIRFSSVLQSAERDSFGSVRDFRTQSAIHLVQFETSERDSFGSVQDSERDSFGSVRYFRVHSAIHLVQFGTSECRARII